MLPSREIFKENPYYDGSCQKNARKRDVSQRIFLYYYYRMTQIKMLYRTIKEKESEVSATVANRMFY